MHYSKSYDSAKSRHSQFLLDELIKLSNMVPNTTSSFGRPVEFPLSTLFVLLGLKFDSGLGYRTFVSQLKSNPTLLDRLGLEKPPSYSILQSAVKRIDPQLLHRMVRLLARERPPPINIAVDATGFSHSSGSDWRLFKFRMTQKRRFSALHAAVDTDTLLVHSVRIRVRPGGDSKEMVPLLKRVPSKDIKTVYGDKAYISRKNVQFIHDLGAYPAIEPKKNLSSKARGHRGYKELIREYRRDPEEWKQVHEYGKRSLVETVFSMMKMRFTGGLRSRRYKEQRRELLIKVILHNIQRLNFLECDGR